MTIISCIALVVRRLFVVGWGACTCTPIALLLLMLISRLQNVTAALPFLNQFFDLCHICRNGQLDLLKGFLYYNKDILYYQHPPTYTSALHQAVEGNQPNVIQLILLHGFNPNIRGRGGLTPLHLAVIKGQASCVHALIDNGADITVKDDQGQDAITKAELQSKKSEAVLKLLRSKGNICS